MRSFGQTYTEAGLTHEERRRKLEKASEGEWEGQGESGSGEARPLCRQGLGMTHTPAHAGLAGCDTPPALRLARLPGADGDV